MVGLDRGEGEGSLVGGLVSSLCYLDFLVFDVVLSVSLSVDRGVEI